MSTRWRVSSEIFGLWRKARDTAEGDIPASCAIFRTLTADKTVPALLEVNVDQRPDCAIRPILYPFSIPAPGVSSHCHRNLNLQFYVETLFNERYAARLMNRFLVAPRDPIDVRVRLAFTI